MMVMMMMMMMTRLCARFALFKAYCSARPAGSPRGRGIGLRGAGHDVTTLGQSVHFVERLANHRP